MELKRHADQILQEVRIVLPGTQALMGFQFIAIFNPVFQGLPMELKYLHFIALILVVFCSFLLIAPVAFQQIGDGGKLTRSFLSYTRKMLTGAMLCLLLAIVGDVYVAARTIGIDHVLCAILTGLMFVAGVFLWFVYTLMRRSSN